MNNDIRDMDLKADFILYLQDHPELRFWQALRNWSNHNFILAAKHLDPDTGQPINAEDTFYWEDRK